MSTVHEVGSRAGSPYVPECSTPYPATVAEALTAIRDSLSYRGIDGADGEQMRSLIRLLCVFARQDALRAEEVIPSFKRSIADSAVMQSLHPDHRDGIRGSLVQFLIKSFYSDAA